MLAILVIVPLIMAAFAAILLRGSPNTVKYLALLASLVSLAIAIYIFVYPSGAQSFQWFNVGGLAFSIGTATQPINMLLLMLVSVITPLVFLYSIGFMDVPSEQPRFYFEMCVFAASMMLFAISSNLITTFIAWEMLGITSYMLIGFWYRKEKAPDAARKAITTILIGDIAMLIGILMIGASSGTFNFATIFTLPITSYLDVALILILIGAFTKSAQFPFHEWLADAMEGPTPVSAFLHSSTMVKAGVFLIAVMLPIYNSAGLLNIMLIIGIVSALIGVSNALTERHIKKILAYSTIEDIGLMFIALGLNAPYAALMLFFVQTFYKALLFMNAGAIMKANDEREDIYKIYGSAINGSIASTMLVGVLSIAAIFPLSGFFGKVSVEVASQNVVVYALILLMELGTSIYIFRWMFVTMRKSFDKSAPVEINYRSIPRSMIAPMYILGVLTIVASAAFPYVLRYIELGAGVVNYTQITVTDAAVSMVLSIFGIIIAYRVYKQGHRLHLESTSKALFNIVYNSQLVNRAYTVITELTARVANTVGYTDYAFDRSTYALSQGATSSGGIIKGIVNGQTNIYVLGFVLGLILLIFSFIL